MASISVPRPNLWATRGPTELCWERRVSACQEPSGLWRTNKTDTSNSNMTQHITREKHRRGRPRFWVEASWKNWIEKLGGTMTCTFTNAIFFYTHAILLQKWVLRTSFCRWSYWGSERGSNWCAMCYARCWQLYLFLYLTPTTTVRLRSFGKENTEAEKI